jgi:surface protein
LDLHDSEGKEYYINFEDIGDFFSTHDIVKVIANRTWVIPGTFKLYNIVDIIGNVSIVGNASGFFSGKEYVGSINHWDVSSVTNMDNMFSFSKFNGDISGWDVSSVTNMNSMFRNTQFNGDISGWDVSSVTNMNSMFRNTQFNTDITGWDISSIPGMLCESSFNNYISGKKNRRDKLLPASKDEDDDI